MSKSPFHQSATSTHRMISVWIAAFAFVIVMIGLSRATGLAQQRSPNMPPPPRPTIPNIDPLDMPPVYSGDPMRTQAEEKRLQYLNAERQKSMVAATNRLVKLAADLNAQINGEQHGLITPDQVRQLADIEKLARNIREKMSTSVRQPASFDSGPIFMPRR